MLGNKYALGHKLTEEHKQAIRNAHLGSKSHFWKDGRCDDKEYIIWQKRQNQYLKKRAKGSFTKEEWVNLKRKYGNKCWKCGTLETEKILTVDHIMPLSKGGTNFIINIQPLCLRCNMKKHAKLPTESW
jgi:5-methylcytosine-specific restriction endonuclease McrA